MNLGNDRKRKFEDDGTEEDATLVLTTLEQRWARQLRVAARESQDVLKVSDWEIARQAVVSLGDGAEETLGSIRQMHSFQNQHDIQGTLEEGMAVLGKFHERFPDVLLNIDLCGNSKDGARYFAVIDLAALIQCVTACQEDDQEDDWKMLLATIYYMSQCMCPQMEGLRSGCTLIMECGGVDWKNAECLTHLWLELSLGAFPVCCQDVWFYNATPEGANSLTLLGIRSFSQELMQRMYIGCQMEVNGQQVSLRNMFSPTRRQDESDSDNDVTQQGSLMQTVEGLLELCFRNEGGFSLH
ncbi:expressed unknown protein [Seminavis robusta]|uniref:Uncharacterized protein n=1 Tax=Seminavis robusta TaxID=568900 RepID=A0A9N8H7K5_9STRA|nr:expressed unknown protein [Seminavis robusta]|eukprot:Sro132_g062550.1 n/a (298) ;mRNA; r:45028-45921